MSEQESEPKPSWPCGCGAEAMCYDIQRQSLGGIKEFYVICLGCSLTTNYYPIEAEAISAFRLATNQKRIEQLEGIIRRAGAFLEMLATDTRPSLTCRETALAILADIDAALEGK